jgi:glucose/arabinose dehydrogenase
MKVSRCLICFCLFLLLVCCPAVLSVSGSPQTNQDLPVVASVQLQPLLSGLTGPVFVTNAGDGTNRLFVVEQGGTIRVARPGATTHTLFLDISTRVGCTFADCGERGLLGLAFHPYYENNGRFFVYYARAADGALQIAEYHVSAANPDVADTAEIPILTIPHPGQANHNGGTIAFGPDGYLYIAPGDGGGGDDAPNNAQNINQLLGKVLRIDIDHANGMVPYSSPPNNPFFGATPGLDEIYAVGMRNPYRFSFDRGTGQLYVGDVGQGAWEEIDIITRGGNYGWRVFEGMHCTGNDPSLCNSMSPCNINGYTCPIAEYSSLNPDLRCAITGGYVYRGPAGTFPTAAYVFTDFCTGEILMLQGATQTLALDTSLNISSFGEDEAGEIYVVGIGGVVQRLTNTDATCLFSILPTNRSFSAGGGTGSVQVTTGVSCPWTAMSNESWIAITPGSSGTGVGVVNYSVDPNTAATTRTGTMTIAGQTFAVVQGAAFLDVPTNHQFYDFIGKLSARSITVGCGGGNYCPESPVTREQMAAFIMRALGEFNPPTPGMQRFGDVPPSNPFYPFIDRLAELGITVGCGGGNYCPGAPVSREQMAAFIMRALGEPDPPSPPSQRFADVPPTNPFYSFIDRLAIRGITVGCGGNNYCPGDTVTRGQMAAFLVRAFNL